MGGVHASRPAQARHRSDSSKERMFQPSAHVNRSYVDSIKYGGKNLSGNAIKHCHSVLFCLCDFVLFLVILSRFFGHHHQIDARISRTPKRVSSTGQTRKTSSTWWNFDSFFIPSWDSNKFDFFYFLQRFNLIRYLETCICFPILLATVQTSALEPLT